MIHESLVLKKTNKPTRKVHPSVNFLSYSANSCHKYIETTLGHMIK